MYSLKNKIEAFGLRTVIINGHKEKEFSRISNRNLTAIILDTVKGKGIDFLEESHSHGFNFFYEPDKYKEVMEKLK